MDELLELITLVQTKKIPKVPIILVGSDFWNEFDSFVKKTLLSRGNIEQKDSEIYTIEDDEEKIIKIIKNAPIRNGERYHYKEKKISKKRGQKKFQN